MGEVLLVAGGKGGVGKTSLTAGISCCLAAMKYRVLCIDADIGLGNLDIALGLSEKTALDFTDIISNTCSAEAATVRHDLLGGLFLINAPSSDKEDIDAEAFRRFITAVRSSFDYIFLDCSAGLGMSFRLSAPAANRGIIVSTPDVASLRDAARTARQAESMGLDRLGLVVNRVRPWLIKAEEAPNIDDAIDETGVRLLGIVPEDERVITSTNKSEPLIFRSSDGAAKAYMNIAKRLAGEHVPLMKLRGR